MGRNEWKSNLFLEPEGEGHCRRKEKIKEQRLHVVGLKGESAKEQNVKLKIFQI